MANKSIGDFLNQNNESKEKVFNNAEMKIIGNILICDKDSFIQVSNISQVFKGEISKSKLPFIPLLVAAIAGFIMLLSSLLAENGTVGLVIGLIILGIVVYIVYKHTQQTTYYGLIIEVTSGASFSFVSDELEFISRVFKVLGNVIEDSSESSNYLINFGSGTIVNQSETGDIKTGEQR